ncbi:ArsC/Spx/MgsR family protein [Sandarakinorhabdus sp.]|uniref:ArsC/Spx/MgsR family protein n=1 Tax=Sandarakinorhabdus sp. TaxID=1916663 RepID=UPI00286E47AA|nr:ArsC/Spx/MgsR family protein [Sandarakinorhabdus sp.]
MALTLFGIRNCDTVKKARAWLDTRGVAYAFHDYKAAGVDADYLARWINALGWEAVLNRAGTTYRALPDAEKADLAAAKADLAAARADLAAAKAVRLMLANPSMIKRPILEGPGAAGQDVLLAGFKPDTWAQVL